MSYRQTTIQRLSVIMINVFFSLELTIPCNNFTWVILSNHLLALLQLVPSPWRHCLAVMEEDGISITLGACVEGGGGLSRHRTKIAFSIVSRLALFWLSVRKWWEKRNLKILPFNYKKKREPFVHLYYVGCTVWDNQS